MGGGRIFSPSVPGRCWLLVVVQRCARRPLGGTRISLAGIPSVFAPCAKTEWDCGSESHPYGREETSSGRRDHPEGFVLGVCVVCGGLCVQEGGCGCFC